MNALSTILRPAAFSLSTRCLQARPALRRAITTTVPAVDAGETGTSPKMSAYAKFNIYKGKGAMQLSMTGPKWKNSANNASVSVEKEGVMFAEFANANASSGQAGYGDRSYNWDNKVIFALRPVELGNFLDEKLIKEHGISLYHDPDKGGANEGAIKKTFAVKVNPDDSYMFSITQSDKSGAKTSVAVPVSQAEMAVIRNLVQYLMPRLLGFDVVASDILHAS